MVNTRLWPRSPGSNRMMGTAGIIFQRRATFRIRRRVARSRFTELTLIDFPVSASSVPFFFRKAYRRVLLVRRCT